MTQLQGRTLLQLGLLPKLQPQYLLTKHSRSPHHPSILLNIIQAIPFACHWLCHPRIRGHSPLLYHPYPSRPRTTIATIYPLWRSKNLAQESSLLITLIAKICIGNGPIGVRRNISTSAKDLGKGISIVLERYTHHGVVSTPPLASF